MPSSTFCYRAYAGTVPYNVTGWLEKNRDPLNDSVVDQFKHGSNKLLQDIFEDHPGLGQDDSGGGKGGKGRKKGSGFQTVSGLYRVIIFQIQSIDFCKQNALSL